MMLPFSSEKRNWTELIVKLKMIHVICINMYNQNFEIIFNHIYDILVYVIEKMKTYSFQKCFVFENPHIMSSVIKI